MDCELCAMKVGQRVTLQTVAVCDDCGEIHQLTFRPAIYKGVTDDGTLHVFDVRPSNERCPGCGGLREEFLAPCQNGIAVEVRVAESVGVER